MKHINTNLFKCFQGIHLREAHPDFDSLQLSQKKKSVSKYIHLPKTSLD